MSVSMTEEQKRAIGVRGKAIVSASAGSGKTFVMIERLVSLVLEGESVKHVLAVTFTNKAAAQMRERLRAALVKRIGQSGEKERLRLKEELRALPSADISTIHAWCARLIRTYFYLADVDPSFRIVSKEDADGKQLSSRALDEVFEEEYEAESEGFRRLLSVYFRKKKDAKLRALVLSLHSEVRGRADYREILSKTGKEDAFGEICDFLAEELRSRARYLRESCAALSARFREEERRARSLLAAISSAAQAIEDAPDLFAMQLACPALAPAPPSTKAEGEKARDLKMVARLSAAVKELYKDAGQFAPQKEECARYRDGTELSRLLAELILRFDERYALLKREAGVLDYDDLEHFALLVLSHEEARTAVRERYRYVFVDEYQDVNPAQERILSLLCGDEVFLVGDAKQSIYGFRGSRSEFFVKKCAQFPASLQLGENFRSAPAVLEAVNRVFSSAMTERTCDIIYREAPMRGGKRYGEHDGAVLFHRVEEEKAEKEERGVYSVLKDVLPAKDAQAEKIADLIAEEVGSEWYDADAGLVKRVTFGDIAVLVRKNVGDAEKIVAALSARDVPVATTSAVNVCDYWEARLFIDWLSYLDNPEQDIPRAGAMLSRAGGFSDSDLAAVRARFPSPYTFREACREYAAKMKNDLSRRLNAFEEKTARYRTLMRVRTAAEMIDLLLDEGLEAEIAAKRDGEARLRRVRRLSAEAEGSTGDFLRKLKTLGYRVDYAESGGENAVKVLTMHAAKGLEFPVVFLASLDEPFHTEREEVLYSDRFSIVTKSYDAQKKIAYDTVQRRAALALQEREERKEELDLLYVAMTRAKYRLHLLFKGKESALAPQYAARFSDFFDFADCAEYFVEDRVPSKGPLPRSALVYRADEALLASLKKAYAFEYPFEESTKLKVKSSATDLMRQSASEEEFGSLPQKGGARPGPVEKGLAYHAFMEHVRFGKSAKEELSRMREEGILSAEELALLSEEKLEEILRMPSLRRLSDKQVEREKKFLLSLPASELPGLAPTDDELVVQGALDVLVLDEEGYLILDYKYSSRSAEELKAHYAPQIGLYRKAVAAATGVDESKIRARLLNILLLYEAEM